MQTAGFKLKARKCKLFSTKVEYLGHVVSKHGVATNPKKIDAVKTWLKPSNVSELRSFLGFCGYYRRYIANFSEIARPLHKLTEKEKIFSWSVDCQNAFERLKHCLTTAPVLAHPDFTKPFILDADASGTAIGAVLSQVQNDREKVIAFPSRSLTKAERKYCVTRKELLAVVHFTKYFKHYLSCKRVFGTNRS
jgi:hypothetical protein